MSATVKCMAPIDNSPSSTGALSSWTETGAALFFVALALLFGASSASACWMSTYPPLNSQVYPAKSRDQTSPAKTHLLGLLLLCRLAGRSTLPLAARRRLVVILQLIYVLRCLSLIFLSAAEQVLLGSDPLLRVLGGLVRLLQSARGLAVAGREERGDVVFAEFGDIPGVEP